MIYYAVNTFFSRYPTSPFNHLAPQVLSTEPFERYFFLFFSFIPEFIRKFAHTLSEQSMSGMLRKLLIFLCTASVTANMQSFAGNGTRKFQYIGTRNGLPDGNINCLMVDHRGALWIGTDAGLAQYDGYTTIKVSDYATSQIYEDGDNNLWIHSGSVPMRYLRKEHKLDNDTEKFFSTAGIDGTQKKLVFTDRSKCLWILTARYLYCYNFNQRKLRTVTATIPGWQNMEYYSVTEDGNHIYIGDCSSHLWSVDKNTGKRKVLPVPTELSSGRPHVYADHNGTLWIYSTLSEQLYRQGGNGGGSWKPVPLPKDGDNPSFIITNAIRQLADNGNGYLWIATDHRGLFCYDMAKDSVTKHIMTNGDLGDMAENNVNTLAVDKNENLWLGHYKRGISYSSPSFSTFSRFAKDCGDVSTLLPDSNGIIWIGTDGNGLFRSIPGKCIEPTPLRDMVVTSLLKDNTGRIWAGTYNSGLYCIDNGKIKKYSTGTGGMPTDMSWKIADDRTGQIWICSAFHPLLRLDPATGQYAYSGNDIYGLSMTKDSDDRLYIGTSYGLHIVNTSTGTSECVFGNKSGNRKFLNQQTMALLYDSHDILWMGHNNGMTAWDLKTDSLWYFTTEQRGICNDLVKSIQEDLDGNIWISTGGGISHIIMADREKGEFYVTNFRNIIGENNNYFNHTASALAADGSVLFGCVNGYISTLPQLHRHIRGNRLRLFFSSITSNGRSLDEDAGKIILSYNDHSIEFRLMTDNPAIASELRYAYSFGEEEWIYISSPVISFASLPSGSYTMRVKACDSEGIWSEERTIGISVTPPLWRSPYMLCLYILTVAVAGGLSITYFHRNNRKKIAREKQSMEQEKNIRVAEMKLRFFTNVSHDLRTPLTLIISPLQTMLREKLPDGILRRLQIMEKNARLLQEQINTLLDFRRLDVGAERLQLQIADIVPFVREECGQFSSYATDRRIDFTFNTDTDKLRMEFDRDKIHKIVYNLLSNAFKHTPDGESISVTLHRLPHDIEIRVADSGPGIADKDKLLIFERFYQSAACKATAGTQHITGSGIGLHIVSEYIRLMKGTVTVADGDGGGAVFICRIPAEEAEEHDSDSPPEGVCDSPDTYTVLVVDDNQDMCEFISTSLAGNYRVLTAANGADALEVLRKENVSLVVSDIMMPVMDGLELCHHIKTDLQLSHIPVIFLTAKTSESSVMEGYKTGADDYLTKPFNIDMLKLRINKFINLARMSHRQFRQEIDVKPGEITITQLDEQFIKRAIEIVEAHINDSGFSVESLGQELAMNRVALWKKIQAITGKGPADFIRVIRIKRGRQLLEQGHTNISEIAYLVGYNTVKRFTENFKAIFGMTPSEYKKSLKK